MSWKAKAFVSATAPSSRHRNAAIFLVLPVLVFALVIGLKGANNSGAHDPGVRPGPPDAGTPIAGLTNEQLAFFDAGGASFVTVFSVTGSIHHTGKGLGPRFDAEGCSQCHAQPVTGGSSPVPNPQVAIANDQGATNQIPFFITDTGPVREARFPYTFTGQVDGSVHGVFTITGRSDAPGCDIQQPNFTEAAGLEDLVFRVPTPVFGSGLIEAIPDATILTGMRSNQPQKRQLGIAGRPNISANDGTITRFGWKAQNKSLEVFAGEAFNVEMGITNEMFNTERDQTIGCQFNPTPEDSTNFDASGTALPSNVVLTTMFMKMLDQPTPGQGSPSTRHGAEVFVQIGCALCHTPSMRTGQSPIFALSNIQAKLYSDLLLHHMGPNLADNISQGVANGDEFRTAPLWGVGQRMFFMHDGRTADLVQAISAHASPGNHQYPSSEANGVVNNYNHLSTSDQQDLLNFLRSL